MKVEQVDITKLVPDPANVRTHDERNLAAIRASLAKFGQQKPIVVDSEGVVLAGNGTLAAALQLGWEKIAVVRTKLTGTEAIAYAIADNRTAELAAWDEASLSRTLEGIRSEGMLDDVGYTPDELDLLLATFSETGQTANLGEKEESEKCPTCGKSI